MAYGGPRKFNLEGVVAMLFRAQSGDLADARPSIPCEPLCSCAAVVSPASVLSIIDIYLAAQPANKPPTIRRHSSFIDLREHVQLAAQAAFVNTSSLCPRAHEYIII